MISSDVVAYDTAEQLRAWAADRTHWPRLCTSLAQHAMGDEAVVWVLPTLQGEPELAQRLCDCMPVYRLPSLRAWLARRWLTPAPATVAEFCALASTRVRRRDPGFPAADPTRLTSITRWFEGERRGSDQRIDAIGWVLTVEDRNVGPAEAIHEDEWTAEAHGAGWGLRIYYFATRGLITKCYEEDMPTTAPGPVPG